MTTTTNTQNVNASNCAEGACECLDEKRALPVFRPTVDILESESEIVLHTDLPGARADDIDINCEDGELTIHARVSRRGVEDGESFLVREYGVGDFRRTFRIGENIKADAISAEHNNGVLTLRLPKTEAARPRRIEVKAG